MSEKFAPRIIEVDYNGIESRIRKNEDLKKSIISVLVKAERMLDEKPSNEVRKRLLSRGYQYFLETIENKFPFPKASNSENYRLLGVDPPSLERSLQNMVNQFNGSELSLSGTDLVMTNQGKASIENDFTYFTQNVKQNEILDFALKICNILKENEKNFIDYCDLHPGAPKGVSWHGNSNVEQKFLIVKPERKDIDSEYKYVPFARGIYHVENKLQRSLQLTKK